VRVIAALLSLAAPLLAADFREAPKLPELALPLRAEATLRPELATPPIGVGPLELAPLIQSLAQIPVIAPPAGAPPRADALFQLDALTAALNAPNPPTAGLLEAFFAGRRLAAPDGIVETPKARQAATVADVIDAAWESPTGREVLRKAERLARKSGARVPVVLKPLGNNYGEYDYVERVLYLNKDVAARDIKEAAATLVHELVHVLQHTRNIPAESLESKRT
jgi:hypothetical protein